MSEISDLTLTKRQINSIKEKIGEDLDLQTLKSNLEELIPFKLTGKQKIQLATLLDLSLVQKLRNEYILCGENRMHKILDNAFVGSEDNINLQIKKAKTLNTIASSIVSRDSEFGESLYQEVIDLNGEHVDLQIEKMKALIQLINEHRFFYRRYKRNSIYGNRKEQELSGVKAEEARNKINTLNEKLAQIVGDDSRFLIGKLAYLSYHALYCGDEEEAQKYFGLVFDFECGNDETLIRRQIDTKCLYIRSLGFLESADKYIAEITSIQTDNEYIKKIQNDLLSGKFRHSRSFV